METQGHAPGECEDADCWAHSNDDQAYIRPCAAFPDGLLFDKAYVPVLQQRGLIGESAEGWAENATEWDFYPDYDDNNMEQVAATIERIVNSWR